MFCCLVQTLPKQKASVKQVRLTEAICVLWVCHGLVLIWRQQIIALGDTPDNSSHLERDLGQCQPAVI
jgi:hypothetical protein